ncbi:MAG: bile acid:sodium symporter family protein [Prolixibacteraceae bacterium]|jgi:BASS family bile acid:Na+ symporter|nr:bile acid:sodium symporter family protein [Prolixibacteraceae bacterium]MBT6005095.1 bile acid:sodium symporter family protein [Prolixibacteraceae bacterium]MBT6763848.1 bile acid:sodium symporter family protein [Prolixibacteraceae bacterium]MBT7000235.1 bile acid:sodium symporter family protein [Prolixibacteraceae bacterium]MBT7393645.1 bile acid:sodium symporter family protein [Prolixibacteraceae bacterium]
MDKGSTIFLAVSLIIIMLGMGLSLVADDFKRIIVYPKAIIVGLVNQLIILPIIGFALVSVFPLQPEIAIGIMILAACPGGPTSNLLSHLAKGDIALSVTLTALSSLITIITIPFIVNFALIRFLDEGQMIKLDVVETIIQIFVIVVLPVSIGMLVRKFKEAFALRMAKPVRVASGIVITLVIFGILIKERHNLISYFQQAGLVALSLNAATMLVGFYSAKIFNIKNRQAISISIESGIQNGTLAISIAVILLGSTAFSIAPAIYSLLMFFTGGIAIYVGNKRNKKLNAN